MNPTSTPEPSTPQSQSPRSVGHQFADTDKGGEFDLVEILSSLWESRQIILGATALFLVMGMFHAWRSTPIYEAQALLQIEAQKSNTSTDPAFARMESLFSDPSETKTEIEILASNLVLGRTVEAQALDIEAQPILFPVIGQALARGKATAPQLEVQMFDIPDSLRGQPFQILALKDGSYQWIAPDQSILATGRPGEVLSASFTGLDLKLQVRRLYAKAGQKFHLGRKSIQRAIADLRPALFVLERGKTANTPATLLGLSLENPNPRKAAAILNEILNQYLRQNAERRANTAAKTRAILQEQLPMLKEKLETSEARLNQFRSRSGSVDLSREADIALQQGSTLGSQISALRQRKEDLLRTYKESSDVVSTLNQQIQALESEQGHIDSKVRSLPRTQQEVLRLSREVQVNTELYTALLNNLQNLQITMAGEVEKARIVDQAIPPLQPIRPNRTMVTAAFALMGLFLGLGIAGLRKFLRRGLEDHRLIESKLGMPVFVTIPHSRAQDEHHQAVERRGGGLHLLSVANPDDLATESLRSLRIMMQFSLKDAPNGVIMVTGPSPSIGKSFVASNLSAVLAETGARVLVVDGDLRRGSLHHYFGLKNRMGGLSEILSGRADWRSSAHSTEVAGLDVISSGILPPDPSELLISPRFSTFIEEASKVYDFIIIDAPPLLSVTDATIIGTRVGTVLLLVKSGESSLDEIATCQKRFAKVGVHIQGCIFNDIKPRGFGYKNQYYRYAYHYSYKKQ